MTDLAKQVAAATARLTAVRAGANDLKNLGARLVYAADKGLEDMAAVLAALGAEPGPSPAPPAPPAPVPAPPAPPTPAPAPKPPAPAPTDSWATMAIPEAATPYPLEKPLGFTVGGMEVVVQTAAKPYSLNIVREQDFDIVRLECRGGDRRMKPSEQDRPIDRCELQSKSRLKFGTPYVMDFGMLIEGGNGPPTQTDVKVFQWHGLQGPGDTADLGPVLSMQLDGLVPEFAIRWDADAASPKRTDVGEKWVRPGIPFEQGVPYHIEAAVCFDPFGKGYARIVANGRELLNYEGPLGYNDTEGPDFKWGIYRATKGETLAMRYRLPRPLIRPA